MPEFNASSRYQIIDRADPTQWIDLTLEDDHSFAVEQVGERTKVFRVLIPKGRHAFGAEFPLFNRDRSAMDSSWNSGQLPRGEVGIVHKVGVAIAPVVCDTRTRNADIEKVLNNALLEVEVNDVSLIEASLETLPIGFGVDHEGVATNGMAAMDATPDRYPLLFTNEAMEFTGKLVLPNREWLRDALEHSVGEGAVRRAAEALELAAREAVSGSDDDNDEGALTRAATEFARAVRRASTARDGDDDCSDTTHAGGARHCMTLESDVMVTFYLHGVFGRVRSENG